MTDLAKLAAGLTEAHLEVLNRLYENVPLRLASREQDKIRRTLRERGLIAHCGKPKRWQISGDGLTLRRHLLDQEKKG